MLDVFEPWQRLGQHFLVEEEQRSERLILGGGGDMLLDRQVREKTIGRVFGQAPGMLGMMELQVAANPVHIRFLGATTVVPDAENFDRAIVKARRGAIGIEAQRRAARLRRAAHRRDSWKWSEK